MRDVRRWREHTVSEPKKDRQPAWWPARPLSPLAGAGRMARRLALSYLAVSVLGLMLSGVQAIGIWWLAALLTGVIVLGLAFLVFNEGMTRGVAGAEASYQWEKQEKAGRKPDPAEDKKRFSVSKAVLAAAIVFTVPLILAVIVALQTKPYTYVLQDLPLWMTQNYGNRADVMAPLAGYLQASPMESVGWLRIVVRLLGMIFVNFFPDPQGQVDLIDRTIPLLMLIYPAAYVAGYLQGPRRFVKMVFSQRKAKKAALRKAEKKSLAEELVSTGATVHYGHRNDVEEDNRHRLV